MWTVRTQTPCTAVWANTSFSTFPWWITSSVGHLSAVGPYLICFRQIAAPCNFWGAPAAKGDKLKLIHQPWALQYWRSMSRPALIHQCRCSNGANLKRVLYLSLNHYLFQRIWKTLLVSQDFWIFLSTKVMCVVLCFIIKSRVLTVLLLV